MAREKVTEPYTVIDTETYSVVLPPSAHKNPRVRRAVHELVEMATPDPVRPEVKRFAEIMEGRLKENYHKPGWKDDKVSSLLGRLIEETGELTIAMMRSEFSGVCREAADVANFAMMIADVCGGLAEGER